MSEARESVLNDCTKEQLIYIIKRYESALYNICEICVEEKKLHIKSNKAVEEVRKNLTVVNDISYLDMQNRLDFLMGKIDAKEYRKRIGLD